MAMVKGELLAQYGYEEILKKSSFAGAAGQILK